MAWNPHLTTVLAFVCEDGTLHMVDAESQVRPALCRLCHAPCRDRTQPIFAFVLIDARILIILSRNYDRPD